MTVIIMLCSLIKRAVITSIMTLFCLKKRFQKDNIFKYTPAFKEEFTQKYRNIFEAAEHVQMIYSSNTENEDVYYVVCYQCWDKQRIWEKNEFDDMFEITKRYCQCL